MIYSKLQIQARIKTPKRKPKNKEGCGLQVAFSEGVTSPQTSATQQPTTLQLSAFLFL